MLDDSGLRLAASHVGGNLADAEQARNEWKALDEVLDYLSAVDTTMLMVSGLKAAEPDALRKEVDVLVCAADHCKAAGVALLYHNHYWEFEVNSEIFNALLDSPMQFCPDLGWIHQGGADVIATLEKMALRIGAVHLKDFGGAWREDFVVLGEGEVPLAESAEWLSRRMPAGMWMIAEQDRSNTTPEDAVARNGAFLTAVIRR
jgi:sugar phosphate isomerase/epimerase